MQKQMLLPPWLAFPQLESGCVGWRMGAGEEYMYQWVDWHSRLTPEEQQAYRERFPMPLPWERVSESGPMLRRGHLKLPLWQEGGRAKYHRQWAIASAEAGTLPPILPFWGHAPSKDGSLTKSCFSQWWQSDFLIDGMDYSCMEQRMMAGKALAFQDLETCRLIMAESDPKKIKALGRKVTPFDGGVWDEVKHTLIVNGNYAKFTQNEELRRFLLATGDSLLVEASPYDTIWGIGLGAENPKTQDPHQWRGRNLLGFALMEVRDEIRRVYANADLCTEQEA